MIRPVQAEVKEDKCSKRRLDGWPSNLPTSPRPSPKREGGRWGGNWREIK